MVAMSSNMEDMEVTLVDMCLVGGGDEESRAQTLELTSVRER